MNWSKSLRSRCACGRRSCRRTGDRAAMRNRSGSMRSSPPSLGFSTKWEENSGCFCTTSERTIEALGHIAHLATSPQVEDRTKHCRQSSLRDGEQFMASPGRHGIWIFGTRQRAAVTGLALAMVLVLTIRATEAAQAQTFQVIHNFAGGLDGAEPAAGLTLDGAGNLYGTTFEGDAL